MANKRVMRNRGAGSARNCDSNPSVGDATSLDAPEGSSAGSRPGTTEYGLQASSEDSEVHTKPEEQQSNRESDVCVPSRRSMTKRGRYGKKWVSLNYERKEELKAANNGVMPFSSALITSPFPHCEEWSEENLPEILFFIKPPKSEFEGRAVKTLTENGRPVIVGQPGNPLRDLPILPRRISLEVAGWLVEAWRRIDPRIRYSDILDRQIEDHELGLMKIDRNAFQNHCRRECRMVLGLWTSYDRREIPHRTDVEAIESLTYENVVLNTVLARCPERPDRLSKVCLRRRTQDGCGKFYTERRQVDDTNALDATFPLDQFVLKSEVFPNQLHFMDNSMLAAWELSLVLSERAFIHGVTHWSKLTDACRPISWFDRTKKKREENDTFDRGCSICTWNPIRDQTVHKEYVDGIRHTGKRTLDQASSPVATDSCQSAKRRRSKKPKGREASSAATAAAQESASACRCCEEARSSQTNQAVNLYPSRRFQQGDFQSFYRDRDEDQQHAGIGQEDRQGSQTQLRDADSTALIDIATSSQPLSTQIDPSLTQDTTDCRNMFGAASNSLRDLSGVGSHLEVKQEELPLTIQEDARTASTDTEDTPTEVWYPPYGGPPAGFLGAEILHQDDTVPLVANYAFMTQENTHSSGILRETFENTDTDSPLSSSRSDNSANQVQLPDLLPDIQAIFSSPDYPPTSERSIQFSHELDQSILPDTEPAGMVQWVNHSFADTNTSYGWEPRHEHSSIGWSFASPSMLGSSHHMAGRSSPMSVQPILTAPASPVGTPGVYANAFYHHDNRIASTSYNSIGREPMIGYSSLVTSNPHVLTAPDHRQLEYGFVRSIGSEEASTSSSASEAILTHNDPMYGDRTFEPVSPGLASTLGLC